MQQVPRDFSMDRATHWLRQRQLLRHEKLSWVWRRIRVGGLCVVVAPLETPFYLHKLFLATPLHLILTTQTVSSNSAAPDSYYTDFL